MVADAPLVRQVRLAALVSSLALLVQGAVVISVPAAIIGAGGALLGARRVGRAPSEAELPLGVALVASLLTGLPSMFAGTSELVVAAVLATTSTWFGWRTCRELAARRRRTWGVGQLEGLQRLRELDDRRATGHPPAFDDGQLPPGPDGAGPHGRDPG